MGSLPKPAYPGNKSGKIVIRVTVDASGKVTGAAFEPKGSTESDAALVAAAVAAARKGPLHGEPCGGAGRYDHLYFPHGVNPRFRTRFRDGRPTAPDAAAVGR